MRIGMAGTIAVISTSLRPGSHSRILARQAYNDVQASGAEALWMDLQEHEMPICDGDSAFEDPTVLKIQSMIDPASGFLLSTPVYNFSANAAAKNLVELAGNSFADKPVGFLCAAGGERSYMSVITLANSLMFDFRSLVIPRFVYATRADFSDGQINSEEIQKRIRELVTKVVALSRLEWDNL